MVSEIQAPVSAVSVRGIPRIDGWIFFSANDIDDTGRIVGVELRGFVMTPR